MQSVLSMSLFGEELKLEGDINNWISSFKEAGAIAQWMGVWLARGLSLTSHMVPQAYQSECWAQKQECPLSAAKCALQKRIVKYNNPIKDSYARVPK